MTDRPDLREILGDDVPPEELERLARVDALLRSVPAPPAEVPVSLTRAVRAATPTPIWTRRRVAVAVALAAALSALFFGLGTLLTDNGGGSAFQARATVQLHAMPQARGASGLISLGPRDAQGNWTLELQTSGLPQLPKGGYYVLWLARGSEYAGTCGTFRAGPGTSTVRMNASYDLREYDHWVISAVRPGRPPATVPWLLEAPITRT